MQDIKNKIFIWLLPLVFLTCLCMLNSAYGQEEIKVIITPDIEYKQTAYKAFASDNKEISLTTFQTEINKHILRIRSKSNASLNEQVNIVSVILGKILEKEKNNEFKTLFIGRLINAFGKQNTQMSERLALGAYESELWDNTKGRPHTGHENYVLQSLSNKIHIFPELSQIFFKLGFSIQVSGIEKVLINRAKKLPFAESLKNQGVKPSARLPYDCLTWFSIKKNQ